MKQPSPKTFYLHVTRRCNLRCVYCYLSAGSPAEEELSTEALCNVAADAARLQPEKIVFTGGEPLLRTDLFQIARAARVQSVPVRLCLMTNGCGVDDQIAKKIARHFDEVRVSVDGDKALHDALRGPESYERALQALTLLKRENLRTTAAITASTINVHIIGGFIRELMGRGITSIRISPLKPLGRAQAGDLVLQGPSLADALQSFWQRTFAQSLQSPPTPGPRACLGRYLNVYPDGKVYPCHVMAIPELLLGNVRKERLTQIWQRSDITSLVQQGLEKTSEAPLAHSLLWPVGQPKSKCFASCAETTTDESSTTSTSNRGRG